MYFSKFMKRKHMKQIILFIFLQKIKTNEKSDNIDTVKKTYVLKCEKILKLSYRSHSKLKTSTSKCCHHIHAIMFSQWFVILDPYPKSRCKSFSMTNEFDNTSFFSRFNLTSISYLFNNNIQKINT